MDKKLIYYGLGCLLSAACAACSALDDAPVEMGGEPVTLRVYIGDSGNGATSRANATLPGGSYTSFGSGDRIGFYSANGNADGGGFANECMVFGATDTSSSSHVYYSFLSNTMNVDYNNLEPMGAYYPYYEKMEDASDPGMPIRRADGRMEDILIGFSSSLRVGSRSISGSFGHKGARLIITLDEGFKEAKDQIIKVRMNRPFKYMKMVDGDEPDRYYKVPKFIEAGNPTEADYLFTAEKNDADGKYYVILPTYCTHIKGGESVKAKATAITLKDDSGEFRTIDVTGSISGELWRGNNYKLTIKLEKLKPTVYPHGITPWDEANITQELSTGINSVDELSAWIDAYNEPNPDPERLKPYGNFDDNQWSFFLTSDIDCANSSLNGRATLISIFKDKFDGRGFTLKNLDLTSTSNMGAGLFQTIMDNAVVENLKIENITVTDNNGQSVGAIASVISGGSITNCEVEGADIVGKSYAGVLAGKMSAGTVSDCIFIGTVAGYRENETSKFIGYYSGGSLDNNNAVNVIYHDINK